MYPCVEKGFILIRVFSLGGTHHTRDLKTRRKQCAFLQIATLKNEDQDRNSFIGGFISTIIGQAGGNCKKQELISKGDC